MTSQAVLVIPEAGLSNDVQFILTVSTFLFTILYGFFITRTFARYSCKD